MSELVVAPRQAFDPIPGAFVQHVLGSSLDHDGNVAWLGFLLQGPGGVTATNDQILCVSRTIHDVTVVARKGDPEPTGRPGETLVGLGGNVRISPHGRQVAWVGTAGGPNGFRDSLYISTPQGTTAVLTVGDPLPPPLVGTFFGLGANDLSNVSFSASGRLAVHGFTNQGVAVFAGLPGQLEAVLYPNMTLTTLPSQPQLFYVDPTGTIAADGAFPFTGRLLIGSGSPATTAADDAILGYVRPGQPPVVVARKGDPAPGMGGLVYSFFDVRSEQVGANGEFAFQAYVTDPAAQGLPQQVFYRASTQGGVPQLVFHAGMVLSDGSVVTGIGNRLAVGPQGVVAGWCYRSGPGISTANDEALLVGQPGAMAILLREGDPAPTVPGATCGDGSGGTGNSFDREGNLVMRTRAVTSAASNWVTLAYHPDHGFHSLFVQGQVIPAAFGFATLVSDDAYAVLPTGGGSTSMHGAHGDVARLWSMNVTTASGSLPFAATGVIRTHLGALSPSTASIPATGGFQRLDLDAGAARLNQIHLMLGSLSWTEPGYQFGGFTIPLVNDFWFDISRQTYNSAVYMNSLGVLDANGRNQMAFALPWNSSFLRGALFITPS